MLTVELLVLLENFMNLLQLAVMCVAHQEHLWNILVRSNQLCCRCNSVVGEMRIHEARLWRDSKTTVVQQDHKPDTHHGTCQRPLSHSCIIDVVLIIFYEAYVIASRHCLLLCFPLCDFGFYWQ